MTSSQNASLAALDSSTASNKTASSELENDQISDQFQNDQLSKMENLLQEMVIENSKLKHQLTEKSNGDNNLKLLTEQITDLNSKLQSSQKSLDDKSSAFLALQTVNDELYKKNNSNTDSIEKITLENKKLKDSFEKLSKKFQNLTDSNKKLTENTQKFQESAHTSREQLVNTKQENQILREKLQEASKYCENQVGKLKSEIEKLTSDKNAENSKLQKTYSEKMAKKQKSLDSTQMELNKLKEYSQKLSDSSQAKISKLETDLAKFQSSAGEQDSMVQTLLETNGQLNLRIQEFTLEVNNCKELLVKKDSEISQLSENHSKNLNELKNKTKELQNSKQTCDNYFASISNLESNIEKLSNENESYIGTIKCLNQNVEEVNRNSDDLKKDNKDLEQQIFDLNNNLRNSNKTLRETIKKEREGLRIQLKAERDIAEKAREELLGQRGKIQELEKLLINEKQVNIEIISKAQKMEHDLNFLTKKETESKTTLFELAEQQQKLQKERYHKETVEWQKDELVKACNNCGIDFGMLTRKHHCRSCGAIFCGNCTPHRKMIPGQLAKEAQRVCNECVIKL